MAKLRGDKKSYDIKRNMLQFGRRLVRALGRRLACLLVIIGVLLAVNRSVNAGCVDDALQRVDRDALLMKSNAVYRVVFERKILVFWLPLSTVTICDTLDDAGPSLLRNPQSRPEPNGRSSKGTLIVFGSSRR